MNNGWTLLSVVTGTFPPSKDLENFLKTFLEEHFGEGGAESKADIIIRFAYSSLIKTCRIGPRGRIHTHVELEQALVILFITLGSPL